MNDVRHPGAHPDRDDPAGSRAVFVLGDLLIDTLRQRVSRNGIEIALPKLSYDLLLALIEAAPAVLSNDALMRRVWPGLVVADKTVNQRVKLLRDALGDDPQTPRYIAGLRGRGYYIAIDVVAQAVAPTPTATFAPNEADGTPVLADTPRAQSNASPEVLAPDLRHPTLVDGSTAAARSHTAPIAAPHATGTTNRPTSWLVAALALTVLVIVGIVHDRAKEITTENPPANRLPDLPEYSIAVLRFENQSGNSDNDYFAAGLTSELSRLLARVRGLRVADASAALPVTGPAPSAAELGQRLGVRWLLRGAVRESGARVRISVELLRTEDAVQRWAEVYDRDKGDIFALQDDIAAAVVAELRPRLEGEMPVAQRTDPEAYALYLRAQYLTMRTSPDGLTAALQLYRDALKIAPDYAAAWEGIARVYQQQAGLRLRPAGEAFELVRDASTRAIAVDPHFGLAHTRLGVIALLRDGDFARAARHMQHGYDLEPGHSLTNGNLAVLLRSMGRIPAAIAYSDRADRMDPLNPRGMSSSAYLHIVAGDFARARERIDQTLQLSPEFAGAHYLRALLLVLQEQYDEALREAARERVPAKRLLATGLAAHRLERTAVADGTFRELEALHARGAATAYMLACASAWRGDRDAAFAWLGRAATRDDTEYDADFAQVLVDPLLRSLHDDARWSTFLARIGRGPEQLAAIVVREPLPY